VISSFVRERLRYTFGLLGLTVAFASPLSGQVARRFESGVVVSGAFVPALAAWSLVLVVLVALAFYETVELKRTASAAV